MSLKAAINVIELVENDKKGALDAIFNHRITETCLPLFNTNGTMRKCQKSKLVKMLKFVEINPTQYIAIVDMGLIWTLAIPTTTDDRHKGDGTEYTWWVIILLIISTKVSVKVNKTYTIYSKFTFFI